VFSFSRFMRLDLTVLSVLLENEGINFQAVLSLCAVILTGDGRRTCWQPAASGSAFCWHCTHINFTYVLNRLLFGWQPPTCSAFSRWSIRVILPYESCINLSVIITCFVIMIIEVGLVVWWVWLNLAVSSCEYQFLDCARLQ